MKNLIEYTPEQLERAINCSPAYKLIIVVLTALLIWQSNSYYNYKKQAESKMERDALSVESYKLMMK